MMILLKKMCEDRLFVEGTRVTLIFWLDYKHTLCLQLQ